MAPTYIKRRVTGIQIYNEMACNFKTHTSENIKEILVLNSRNLSQMCIEHVLLEEPQVKKAMWYDLKVFGTWSQ